MTRLKLAGVLLGALFALAAMATTAFALPDISVTLTGGKYPLVAKGTLPAAATSLGTASGVSLSGTGVTLLLTVASLSALGTFVADFTKVKNSEGIECHSSSDVTGVVLSEGEFHLVYTNLSPLLIGILFLPKELEVICPAGTNTKIKGDLIGGVTSIGTEATELTSLGGILEGKTGKQNIKEFYNDGGTKVAAKLESESGAGFVGTDENVTGELKLEVQGSQMLTITGR